MDEYSIYEGAWSGAQIDSAIGKVVNADATPTASSTNMVTSGGVKSALTNVENSIPILFDNNFYDSQLSLSDANKAIAMEGCYQSLIKTGKKITTFLRFNGGYYVPVIYTGSTNANGNPFCLEINPISYDLRVWVRDNSTSTWSIKKTFT